jgi:arginine/lysine/ornithine decarboxylase
MPNLWLRLTRTQKRIKQMKNTKHRTSIATFRNKLNSLAPQTSLHGQELSIEYDCVSLKPIGTHIVAGVVLELPPGFRARDLLEGLRIGQTNFMKILDALQTMAATSSRIDQGLAMDLALDRLSDFSKILIGIHHSSEPEPTDFAATTSNEKH